ncbi:unnamed protein product [Caretta caretta]
MGFHMLSACQSRLANVFGFAGGDTERFLYMKKMKRKDLEQFPSSNVANARCFKRNEQNRYALILHDAAVGVSLNADETMHGTALTKLFFR